MESIRFFKVLRTSLHLTNYFGSAPYTREPWDAKYPGTFLIKTSPPLIKKCYAGCIMIFCHGIFFAARAASSIMRKEFGRFCFSMLFCSICGNLLSTMLIYLVTPKQFSQMMNAQYVYFRDYHRRWMPLYNPETSRVNKILDLMSYTTVFFVGLGHILCFLHFLYLPKTSIYISSLNILQFKDYFVQKLAYLGFAGFYFHFFGTIYSLILFHCLVVKTYVSFIFHKIVSDFRCILGNGKKHGTITKLRHPDNLFIEFRSLQVIHRVTISIYGPILLPTETFCGGIVILGVYMLVRHSQDLNTTTLSIVTTWSISMFLMYTGILRVAGIMFRKSKKTIDSWKHFGEANEVRKFWRSEWDRKIIGRFRKSCRPLAIEFPGYYRFNHLSVLKFMQGIVRGSMRVILALK
ncbi:Pre-B-cell leukemia transcription factor-interacting protein 1 [Folsomia candida]|uniref:Pre-B-cell leukemia transcription factor-interacting protein 1 n=1 Tax=Folsomia candida TaxID=158441 RepID=A0A226DU21_FOLCA|nr:Pre-B-cell leukemia transcription factor-interacting protein 1 [Folsomia candida]